MSSRILLFLFLPALVLTSPGTFAQKPALRFRLVKSYPAAKPMAQKALRLGRPMKAESKNGWPMIFIPIKKGKLMMDITKKL